MFPGYELKAALESDAELATRWIEADDHHRDRLTAEFWTKDLMGVNCFLLHDDEGPVFFFRIQFTSNKAELMLYIQFGPPEEVSLQRTRQGLMQGLGWLESYLNGSYRKLCFTSRNPILIAFCTKRLGFMQHGERLEKEIA